MEEELKQLFGPLEDYGDEIVLSKLPSFERKVLEHFLIPLNPGTPVDSLLVALNAKLAQIMSLPRLKIKLTGTKAVPANYYGLVFMPSGVGKDRPLGQLNDHILPPYQEMFDQKAKDYEELIAANVEEKAKEKFEASKAERERYREAKSPRRLHREVGTGTVEGLTADREAFSQTNFGGTFFQVSEFSGFITSQNGVNADFLTFITEIYDGNNQPKTIKGEKYAPEVKGVPSNCLLHSSLSGIISGPGKAKLLDFLNRGLARRTFVCYPLVKLPDYSMWSLKDYINNLNRAQTAAVAKAPGIRLIIKNVIERVFENSVVELSEDANYLFKAYEIYNLQRKSRLSGTTAEGLGSEVANRAWKVLKLAAISAMFNHSKTSMLIERDDIWNAIYQAEVLGKQLAKFYSASENLDSEKVFNLLVEAGGKWLSTMDIRKASFVSKNRFGQWFAETIKEVEELANIQGYFFEARSFGKTGNKYRVSHPNDKKSMEQADEWQKEVDEEYNKLIKSGGK